MFICPDCAKKTGWTWRVCVSCGLCELCDRDRPCDDVHPMGRPAKPGSLQEIKEERDRRRYLERLKPS
jgi:hypothetical protein